MKVGFVSLGCSKNLVDTEMTIGLFKNKGYEIVNDASDANIIVVNTCGFIESAKQEAIDTLIEMAQYKDSNCKYLIAMGCLVERYKDELEKELPEVDLFVKYSEYESLWEQIESKIKEDDVKEMVQNHQMEHDDQLDYMQRIISTGKYFAYLKIADGCDNRCTFCAIPYIRGKQISRKMEDIIDEAKRLASQGIKEVIVIAQDTTKYGVDIYGESKLAELLEKLCKIKEIKWVRFLYSYPETITDELIHVVRDNDKICKYFDIPIQHISNTVLKRMNRKSDKESIKKVITKLREQIPGVIIRSTLMVGFPGETNEDFEQLTEFVKWAKFDKLGVFAYSKEDGTPASRLKEFVHPMTKKSRYHKIMSLQQEVSKENIEKKIGKTYEVFVETKTKDGKYYVGRTYMDVPEIDGLVYIKNDKNKIKEDQILEGRFIKCKVTKTKEYDMITEIL